MSDWQAFSAQLEEWREHPVTVQLQQAMAKLLAERKQALSKAYLAGKPAPEETRLAVLMVEEWVSDFFESSADDVKAVMEKDR